MTLFGALGFLNPWVLAGLLALPVIWWLLRFTPPRPKQVVFPPPASCSTSRMSSRRPRKAPGG